MNTIAIQHLLPANLFKLRSLFQNKGFDIRLVGGCVRDVIMHVTPHDIDLCTDATPDEQLAIYREAGLKYIETGLQHGTITVVIDQEPYEITSLRTEADHDGRYAKMTYTRDWVEDLSRRDLTINAMAATFDGELIDPFNGATDVKNGIVRFVGDADSRMTEDYLRILRYFRFLGRIHLYEPLDIEVFMEQVPQQAILNNMFGLTRISVERVWAEVYKILQHQSNYWIYPLMLNMGIHEYTPLPLADENMLHRFKLLTVRIPDEYEYKAVLLMCAFFRDEDHAEEVARALKWGNTERELVRHVMSYKGVASVEALLYQVQVMNKKRSYVEAAARFHGIQSVVKITSADLNTFPLTGSDLKGIVAPGPQMGKLLFDLKERWFYSGACMTASELLNTIQV